jgi:N-acetylmuramoyl-L-alanine amidase
VLVLVVTVACSQPSRPRDDEPPHGARPAVGARATADAATGPAAAPTHAASTPPTGDAAPTAPAGDAAPTAPADAAPGGEVAGAASDAPAIVDAPMAWSAERERLTLAYRRQHSDPDAADLVIDPRVIVLHYTAGGSAAGTRRYFDNVRIEAARKQLAAAGVVNVSAHFIVDRDGTIYQLQPPTRFARHCIGLNHLAIGIENVGDEAAYPLTDAQVAADAALVRMLARRYRITHLLGHQEVMKFRDHPYYVERDAGYKNDKPDPGRRFMALVRARVTDLGLRGL